MDNFRDSYFQVDWDLTTKRLKGTYWGKQYDTGRGFAVTVINGGQVVTPTNEVLRLKWEKPDNTTGYVNATIVNGKFIVENIDQMFTVHGSVRADFELSVGGKFVASITFYVSVEKAVAVDAIESSSDFTALQDAVGSVDSLQQQFNNVVSNVTVDSEVITARGTKPTLGARLDSTDAQLAEKVTYGGSSKNLFDGKFHDLRIVYPAPLTVGVGAKSAIIKCKPSTVYSIYKSLDTSIFRAFTFESYPVVGASPISNFANDTSNWLNFKTENNANYILVVVSPTSEPVTPSEFFVSEDAPVDFKFKENTTKVLLGTDSFIDGSITPDKLSFFERSKKNLFDGKFSIGYINIIDKIIIDYNASTYVSASVAIIKVKPLTKYSIAKSADTSAMQYGFFNTYPTSGSLATYVNNTDYSFTTQMDTQYVAIQVSAATDKNKIPSFFSVTEGDFATDEAPYIIKSENLSKSEENSQRLIKWLPIDYAPGIYEPTIEPSNLANVYGTNINALYAEYDALVSTYPEYVTRTHIATESSGIPLYRYDFKPPNLGDYVKPSTTPEPLLKFLHVTGTHGGDIRSIEVSVEFFKDLCLNWETNPQLSLLRWNIHFIVIPCLSPYGFGITTNTGRLNANGVNINRNFSEGWSVINVLGSPDYQGASPLSEIESQAIDSIMTTEAISFAIDFHHFGGYPDINPSFSHVFVNNNSCLLLTQGILNFENVRLKTTYPAIPTTKANQFHLRRIPPSGWLMNQLDLYGIPGLVLEVAGNTITGADYSYVRKMQTEILGNFYLEAYRKINEITED